MEQVFIDAPFLSTQEYARRSGLKQPAIIRLCRAGRLPVMKRESEKEPFIINNALLIKNALKQEF